MSEFDTSGFSAIDRFFGGNEHNNQDKTTVPAPVSHPKGERRGVGSSAHVPSKVSQNDITQKLLKVGRKRGRVDEDDDEEENGRTANNDGDDDEEEEAGRTAIATKVKPKLDSLSEITSATKSKKKLGKKERQKQQQETTQDSVSDGGDGHKAETTNDDASSPAEGETSAVADEATSKKHKRRKVRSKQKNIRKDHREKKPDHLVVGRKYYQGRPLTTETREKLHLPPPKLRTPFAVGPAATVEASEVEAGGLAIDDFLGEDTGQQVESTVVESVERKKNKKNKKSKYKNLKV